MGLSSNFTQYLTKKLTGLSANNIGKSGSLNFGSLTQMNNHMSIFENSASNISSIDFNAILKALEEGSLDSLGNEGDQSIAAILNEIMAIQEMHDAADVSEDGEISAEELEKFVKELAGADGDASNLTFADIDTMLEKMGINLNDTAEKAVSDVLKEIEAQEAADQESIQEAAKAEEARNTQAAQQSSGTSGSSSAGGRNYAPSSSGASRATSNQTNKTSGETAEEIKAQIADKNDEIDKVEEDAEAAIQEQEKAKEEAMKNAGVSEEEYKKYQEQEQKLETQIKDKESAISSKDDEIRDKDTTIESNKNYISSLEAQVSANESKKVSSDQEGASEKNANIEAQINNLKNEISAKKAENTKLEQDKTKAEEEKRQLEADKKQLETDKQTLLSQTLNDSKGFAKGGMPSDAVNGMKNNIASFDSKIQDIRAEKSEKTAAIKSEIQTLEVKLKDVEAKETRDSFIKDNSAKVGLGLTGEELVDVAKEMLQKYGSSTGYCATGVSRTFAMAYGLNLHGNGCDWTANMDNLVNQGAFEEVTGDYATSADLANLPAGAVVTWDSTGGTSGGAKYGHVTIADGHGGEISDHYAANIYKKIGGRSDTYHVYLPVA